VADVNLELLATNQRKILAKLDKLDVIAADLGEVKTMLRLQRELIDISGLDRNILESQIARLEKRVARLEERADEGV
jgi:hypothetical protein